MAKILLVEDDESTAEFVRSWLVDENHIVEHSANGNRKSWTIASSVTMT